MTRVRDVVAPALAIALSWSCRAGTTDVQENSSDREAFIGAYVDLRAAVMLSGTTEISGEVRDSILAVYGVTGDELLEFVDANGERIEFMSDLWTEIEGRLSERLQQDAEEDEPR